MGAVQRIRGCGHGAVVLLSAVSIAAVSRLINVMISEDIKAEGHHQSQGPPAEIRQLCTLSQAHCWLSCITPACDTRHYTLLVVNYGPEYTRQLLDLGRCCRLLGAGRGAGGEQGGEPGVFLLASALGKPHGNGRLPAP